jgi:hypothetical protein
MNLSLLSALLIFLLSFNMRSASLMLTANRGREEELMPSMRVLASRLLAAIDPRPRRSTRAWTPRPAHLDQLTEDHLRRLGCPRKAPRAARRDLGGVA